MNDSHKSIFLNVLGVFFIVLGFLAIARSIYNQIPTQILYMCYLGLILIGVGILMRNSFIIMSQVYILAIPLLVWNIDFLYQLIFGGPLWGITDYFFFDFSFTVDKLITLQHIFTIPLSIYAASLIGLKRKDAWKLSFAQIILVYIVVVLISPPELNVNCVFDPCINISLGLPYGVTWFLIIFSMTYLSSLLLNFLPIIKVKK